ncbi:hypothetical protein F511_12694 [Dorcoceras hygrometricum]|uniref:Uncharacterized protein n=1 Tax=Dorcoceras hygrometricum TaxID=472368 RepID=A0A2Z7D7F6_9LAMI|nr:hypothetical protein F511_12694 [Dorcoceras hygrometricum]
MRFYYTYFVIIQIEHAGPLGSLGLNDAGDDSVDFMPTDEYNGAPTPFDDEWEEEPEEYPEEEGLEDIPIGEGEIVDE